MYKLVKGKFVKVEDKTDMPEYTAKRPEPELEPTEPTRRGRPKASDTE